MKSIPVDPFFSYASQFTLESVLFHITQIAIELFKNTDSQCGRFSGYQNYAVTINGHQRKDRVLLVQTWLIDCLYHVICFGKEGKKIISKNETLYLIHLFCNYQNNKPKPYDRDNHLELLLYVNGFGGEQFKYESLHNLINCFSRENYILNIISQKKHPKNNSGIEFEREFFSYTGLLPLAYSSILFGIFTCFATNGSRLRMDNFRLPQVELDDIKALIEKYSCTLDEIRSSSLKRQILYKKPIIKLNGYYIASNPFLIISLFVNSNYWVMRDKYLHANVNKQKFVNAFGSYFEIYFEEILKNCLPDECFNNIPEGNEKRADWIIRLNDFIFLIEQKSSLSVLGIKQSEPDINLMKKHIIRNWGEAVEQLDCTEKALEISNAIKIVLVYENYFLGGCFDLLFELKPELQKFNNQRFWFVNIDEFEMMMITYKHNVELFFKIVQEKLSSDSSETDTGQDLTQLLSKHGIFKNDYLDEFGISDQFYQISDFFNNEKTDRLLPD